MSTEREAPALPTPEAMRALVEAGGGAHADYWRARGCEVEVTGGHVRVIHPRRYDPHADPANMFASLPPGTLQRARVTFPEKE